MNLEQIYLQDINRINELFNKDNERIATIAYLGPNGLTKGNIFNIR
ncbi:MAG: hypothetical protein IJK18_01810 [Clostridia bacterium]|nr:hypothetical protein [Clostridia bacterium]